MNVSWIYMVLPGEVASSVNISDEPGHDQLLLSEHGRVLVDGEACEERPHRVPVLPSLRDRIIDGGDHEPSLAAHGAGHEGNILELA